MKIGILIVSLMLMLSVMPMVIAAGDGGSTGGTIGVEDFQPLVFQCGNRVLTDDDVQPWRITDKATSPMIERNQQYLFDGERYQVDVLVLDKNKVQSDIVDLLLEGEERCNFECVNGSCVPSCEEFDDKMVNCVPTTITDITPCNVKIGEEEINTFDSSIMKAYTCSIDILDSEHMYGLYWLKVRAENGAPGSTEDGEYKEVARWFINPVIELDVDGDFDLSGVRPGTSDSTTVLLQNYAEGGVLLDVFVTGKDWPAVADSSGNLGRCWDASINDYANYLPLSAFTYYAENGAFSTRDDAAIDNNNYDSGVTRTVTNGYVNVQRQLGTGFDERMFDEAEVIQANAIDISGEPGAIADNVYLANLLYPGSAGMSLTFKLDLPEPCYGNFESGPDGNIFFWAEAV